jgi:hypothetical protein
MPRAITSRRSLENQIFDVIEPEGVDGRVTNTYPSPSNLPLNPLEPFDVTPVPWFERVVSLAAQKFLLDQTAALSPFVENQLTIGAGEFLPCGAITTASRGVGVLVQYF